MNLTCQEYVEKVIHGGELSHAEVMQLVRELSHDELLEAAKRVTRARAPRHFDFCGIVNARSGACSENCAWCAQSHCWQTGCAQHGWIGTPACLKAAQDAESHGASRFALVTSGRAPTPYQVREIAEALRVLHAETRLHLCVSIGLATKESLSELKAAGLERVHCNLETAPSRFADFCTTHTVAEKISTLRAARELGLAICCGGILGMGETREERIEFAFALREIAPDSIPMNVLHPISGTPLEHLPPLAVDDLLETIALFRLVNPTIALRFAGGRRQISDEIAQKAMEIGINAGIAGNLLTTKGALYDDDRHLAQEAGYSVAPDLR